MGLLERLSTRGLQFVVMDLEGDCEGLGDAMAVGSADDAPRPQKVLEILRKTPASLRRACLG